MMQRYLRLPAVPALLFLAAASPCCSFLHPSSVSSPFSCSKSSVSTSVGAAVTRRGGGVVALGMKRKNGASGQQQGFPGGRDGNGARGGNDEHVKGRADQQYAYVQGGFAERQAPTQGNNTNMCVPLSPSVTCFFRVTQKTRTVSPKTSGVAIHGRL